MIPLHELKINHEFLLSTDKEKLNVRYIQQFLSKQSYWAQGISLDVVERSIMHSACFGVYQYGRQIGFARVISDLATFAYLADVFIDSDYRRRGLSKHLLSFIFSIEEFKNVRRFLLATRDAHLLYASVGFKALNAPDRFMEIYQSDIYSNDFKTKH